MDFLFFFFLPKAKKQTTDTEKMTIAIRFLLLFLSNYRFIYLVFFLIKYNANLVIYLRGLVRQNCKSRRPDKEISVI